MTKRRSASACSARTDNATTPDGEIPVRAAGPTIVFTDDRKNDRYQVRLKWKRVELPLSGLKAMIKLTLARGNAGNGFTRVNAVTIFRLRRIIDAALGAGAGNSLVETGARDEYRLAIRQDELGSELGVTSCFLELVELKVVAEDQALTLLSLSKHRLQSAATRDNFT